MSSGKSSQWDINRNLAIFGYVYYFLMAIVLAYLWLIAQNRYISESMFKVSTEAGNSDMSDLAMAQAAAGAAGLSGAQTANGYISSADLLLQLEKEFNLQKHYSSPRYDFVFRLEKNPSIEERIEYYRKRITSHYDLLEGVTIVSVDTFDREFSRKINERILDLTETFINGINHKIAGEQLQYYVKELERADQNVLDLNRKIVTMQDRHRFISPEAEVTTISKIIEELTTKRKNTEGEIATLSRDSPDSPRIKLLQSHLKTLNESIDVERSRLSGKDQQRMNLVLMEHEDLKQQLAFAIELRNNAKLTLEKNRALGTQHSRFFILFQKPYTPEKEGQPRRPYATITIFVLGSLIFLILRALAFTFFERA